MEIGQLTHHSPTFSCSDAKGMQYVSLGGGAFITDGKLIKAYRGRIQELQQEVKLQTKPQEVIR